MKFMMPNALTQSEQYKQLRYNVTLRRVRVTIAGVEKQRVLHNLSVHLHLRIYHAMRMRHTAICGLSRSTIFSTLSLKRHDFRKTRKVVPNTKCVF